LQVHLQPMLILYCKVIDVLPAASDAQDSATAGFEETLARAEASGHPENSYI